MNKMGLNYQYMAFMFWETETDGRITLKWILGKQVVGM
jgi:hypothetical protein